MNWFFYFLFNFVMYSFLGWCLEELYCFIKSGHLRSENFLSMPFKPMYGFAAISILYLYDYVRIKTIYIIPMLILVPTFIEYISGYLLKHLFNKRYWNYDDLPFNFQGIICIKFSVYWAIISAFILFAIQPIIKVIYKKNNIIFNTMSIILLIIIIIDLIFNVKLLLKSKYMNAQM